MANKNDDSERTKAVSSSEPVEIRRKFKMEGSTTDSDFSDLDIQTFAEKTITSPPPSKSESSLTGSPHKRGYHPYVDNFNTGDFYSEQSPKKRNLNQYPFGPGKENLFNLNWTNSESSRDSALGGSLMSTLGSVLTDTSSSYETNSDSEQSSSGHSVYGRYQKIDGSSGESGEEEVLVLHRLPGENLGMILGIDSDPTCQTVKSVYVKTVTIGGAAYRATGSKKGIQEGDQILQINGTDLNILTHDECLTVLREMPLRVILKICRGKKRLAPTAVKLSPAMSLASSKSFGDSPSPLVYSESSSYSESEEEEGKFDGFVQIHVEIDKHPSESLGLSIVPSYGSTRQFYQIKRLLPSGAAARTQHIRVGDRLVSCNGISLRNVSQSKCLSILKLEGNSGDLELELLRPKENEEQLEISLKVSNTDSTLTLHSPSQQRKNFIADLPESDSDNEVVLNKFQYFDKTELGQNLRTNEQNQKSEVPKVEKIENSDIDNTKRDFKFTSKNSKMDESSESWNYAVPPPIEFSTYGPAVPPPAEFSEGQSPIFNQSDNGIPVTNIDEIIKSYSQSPVVQSHDSYIPQTEMDDTEVQIRHLESLSGLHGDENGTLDNSVTYFDENLPGEGELDMMDSFHGDNDMNDFVKEDQSIDADEDVDAEPFIPPAPVNTEDIDLAVGHSNSDDEFVVPVTVQRQKNIPFTPIVTVPSAGPSEVEEEQIIPSLEQRKRTPASATIKLEEIKKEELPPKPVPQPRVKPTIISVKQESVSPKSSMDEEQGVEEEIVRAEFKERQSVNEKFKEKLGVEVEEEIVPVTVKKDQSWNAAKIAVITNMWSKSASKSNENVDDSKNKNLKSVINVMNSKRKQQDDAKDDLAQGVKEEITNSTVEPREQGVYKNVIEVTAPISVDVANVENKPEKVDSVPSTDKHTDSKLPEPVNTETSAQQNVTVTSTRLDAKPTEIEKITFTSVSKSEETAPVSVSSKTTENSAPSVTSSKTAEASPVSPFKSSIGITKPSSLLSTIRSQNTSSATLRPLSSIKPITVSAKTFSLGKPASLPSTLSSGRPSLLSTIHGTTTSTRNTRSEEEPFLVSVLKGILGLGLKVSLTPEGFVKVDEIQSSGPIAKDGNIRVGDFLLSINNTELTGLPESKVQQILRLLPRGIAKILVSVKPPSSEGVARPKELSLSSNESRQSPLSSPRTMSKSASVSPSMSPRQCMSSPSQPLSPQQPSKPSSRTPAEESSVKVTVNHNQLAPETNKKPEDESPGRVTVKHDQYAPGTKKTPPPVAPKPKQTSSPDHISKTGSHWGGGGYVSSAIGRTSSFGKKESQVVDNKPHIQPKKADYVSSARKAVHEKEEKEPIDTVVFASVDFNKMNAVSRHSMGESKDKNSPEPKMIPKGHVDYVSSAKPKVSSPTTSSPQKKDIPYSPYAYEEVSTKITPVKINSALSPRRKSEDKFSFGSSFSGNRTKGKDEDQHTTGSPLSSPKSPVTPTTQQSPNIKSPPESEIVVRSPLEVPTKPVPRPRGSISDKTLESTEPDTLPPADSMPTVESINPNVENTDHVTEQPCMLSSDKPNITNSPEENVDSTPEAHSIDIDVVISTESQKDTAVALTDNKAQDNNVVISPDIDLMNVEDNTSNVEIVKDDSDVEGKKDIDTSESLIVLDDSDNELFEFVEEIVRNAIQKGIDEFKASEAEDKAAEDDEEGKKVDNKKSRVHDTHPVAVMETKSLRAFLQKLDSSEKEMPLPDTYSMNQNPVAENIAADMLKSLQEDSDNHARHTNSATKTSASTSNDLLTYENSGVQVDQCMSVSHDASVACNDAVLDSPNPVSMSVEVVNVPSVASVGDNIVNTLSIQEPKLYTEQLNEDPYTQDGRDIVDDNVNSDVNVEVSQQDLENIEIILNEESVETSPINLLGGDISQSELNSGNYFTISSKRSWLVCVGEQQFSPEFSNLEDIGGSLDRSPEELKTLLNKTNNDLDAFGFGLDARIVLFFLNSNAQGENLGVQLSTDKDGYLMISEVMEGSLADREAHIQVGDKVISLDGESTASLSPEDVMNGIDNTTSNHVIVLTRVGEDCDGLEAPPTPEAPPPALPISQPPDIPKEDEIKEVISGSLVEELSENESENKVTQKGINDLKVEIPSANVETHEDSMQNSDSNLEVTDPEESAGRDSITVTIPEVSSPQGSQDSGVDMPSPLDTQSMVADTASSEKPNVDVETELSLSNGDLNQVSSPTSPLERLQQLLPTSSDDNDDENVAKDTFEVVMNKGVTGLGFLIEGGKASAKGDQPLTIRRIFKGGPAEKCGMLKTKDEILKVNGLDITDMRHSEAWTHLKFLDDGPVHLLIRRKVKQPVE